jgi:ribosomal protein S18 acetylase RimI-like enzyme
MVTHQGLVYRRCRKEDLPAFVRLILRTADDLRGRTGKEPFRWRPRSVPEIFAHLRATDPETFLCAWSGRRLVGVAGAVVRGKQWYLCWLFVDRRCQDRGVGRELLRRVWRESPGMSHALGTFTYNQQAVGLYTSFGMLPHEFLTLMEGASGKIRVPGPTRLEVSEGADRRDVAWINRLEKEIRGHARPPEWNLWSRSGSYRVLLFRRGGRRVGYGMIGPRDEVHPVGVVSAAYLPDALSETIRAAIGLGRKKVRLICPNSNRELYRFAHGLGLRNVEMLVFMTDEPCGDFSRYVPAPLAVF